MLCCFYTLPTRKPLILSQNLQFHLFSHHHAATQSWVFNPSKSVWRVWGWLPACWAQNRSLWRGAPAEQVGGQHQGSSSRAVKAGVLSLSRYLESSVRSRAWLAGSGREVISMWRIICSPPDVRLYHTATSLTGGGVVVFGGRSSPLNPVSAVVRLTVEQCISPDPTGPKDGNTARLHMEKMTCTGAPPAPRWRHSAAVVEHCGEMQPQIRGPGLHKLRSVIPLLV